MPSFSKKSMFRLRQCDIRLQTVFNKVVKDFDCTIVTGHRDEKTQNEKFTAGLSKVRWPDSKHNSYPSKAIDAVPYPIDWQDRERATLFAGFVIGVAEGIGIKIRWGGDWDRDWQVKDNGFDDLWHFELMK